MEAYDKLMWIFDCPLHGEEIEMFCFRGANEENADRWHLYQIIKEEIPTTAQEKLDKVSQLRNNK